MWTTTNDSATTDTRAHKSICNSLKIDIKPVVRREMRCFGQTWRTQWTKQQFISNLQGPLNLPMEGGSTMMDSVPKQKMTGGVERQGTEVKLIQRQPLEERSIHVGKERVNGIRRMLQTVHWYSAYVGWTFTEMLEKVTSTKEWERKQRTFDKSELSRPR